MTTLQEELKKLVAKGLGTQDTRDRWTNRISEGFLVRERNPRSHAGCFIVPIVKVDGEYRILLGLHKKAGEALPPGGHLDYLTVKRRDEWPEEGVLREIGEELEVPEDIAKEITSGPFWITITDIDNPNQTCKTHLDIWYFVDLTGITYKLCEEFEESWLLTIEEAIQKVRNLSVKEGIVKLSEILSQAA